MRPLPFSMLVLVATAALFLAGVSTPVFRALALRGGLVDRPNARSSHDRLVARGGGAPLLLAAAAGLALAGPTALGTAPLVVVLGCLVLAAVGFCDDRFGLSPLTRIAFHFAAAIAVVWASGGWERLPLPHPLDAELGRWGAPLAVVWIVAVVNFYNFLDGIDGLAAAQGMITGVGLMLAGWNPFAAACGAAVAGACAGFLLHNWAPARIFMGDVGSGALGFLFASLPLLASPPQRSRAALFVALSLWFFLADATWTLARRIVRGERWYEAHRQHLYQQLVAAGASHAHVTSSLALGALVLTAAALGGWYSPSPLASWIALGLAVAGFGLELTLARRARRTRGSSPGTAAADLVTSGAGSQTWTALRDRLLRSHRRWILLGVDALFAGAALYLAYLLRFEGRIPADYWAQFVQFLPLLMMIRLAAYWVFGVHHWSFRLAGLSEGVRLALAGLAGSAGFVAIPYFLQIVGPPRSVVALEFFLSTSLAAMLRFSFRLTQPLMLDRLRSRAHEGLLRTLIVGAGSAGDLLLRDLKRSPNHPYEVVGFVDDNPAKWRAHVGGRPVLGSLDELPEIAGRLGIHQLLFAINELPASRVREILARCADLKLKYKSLPVSFAYLRDHVNATMLHDLAPEDLLARDQTAFDPAELRALVEGRPVLVTGGAGSIGSEACRQLAEFGASRIVLVDINENDMYFLFRELQSRYPKLSVRAEIADVRDRDRLLRLGREYRPAHVFHAAAHKHVPLMEYAPEEAIKNNVTGCRNAVEMAEAAAASHFVLISTDKAVKPTSVMGATKKVAELIVRERATRSSTAFTVVRFGNVLGSAGSVVPLFKQQIAAGGPVTVTHPECRRFLMTIPEAVGLVLLAGLGGYGDLCVLEMGEPIRILDLARLMITMSGLVPEQDVPIVFTGLRPGEKLDEVVMTAEEMLQSQSLRHKIRVVRIPPPNRDLLRLVCELEAAALGESRGAMLVALRAVVPDYAPASLVGAAARQGA